MFWRLVTALFSSISSEILDRAGAERWRFSSLLDCAPRSVVWIGAGYGERGQLGEGEPLGVGMQGVSRMNPGLLGGKVEDGCTNWSERSASFLCMMVGLKNIEKLDTS